MQSFLDLRLSSLSVPAKLLFTAMLMTLGTGYLFAITNIATKIGFSQEQVALRYYGNEASRQALEDIENSSNDQPVEGGVTEEEEMSFDDLGGDDEAASEPIVPVPTFEALVSEGHFHLFGYTSIFFLCGLVLLLAEMNSTLKSVLIVAPFLASVLDIWSMLLTRFIGPGFAWMLIISGMVMAMSFLLVFVVGIYQLWFIKNEKTT